MAERNSTLARMEQAICLNSFGFTILRGSFILLFKRCFCFVRIYIYAESQVRF